MFSEDQLPNGVFKPVPMVAATGGQGMLHGFLSPHTVNKPRSKEGESKRSHTSPNIFSADLCIYAK